MYKIDMKLAYAIFYTENIVRIKAFYENSLGFKVAFAHVVSSDLIKLNQLCIL